MSEQKKQQKIEKLVELNDELENYFRNTIIPQLFVDSNMRLRKFTPPAMKQFSFSPDDIGKSMDELIDNIRYSTIIEDVFNVIKTGEIYEKEIQTSDFRWFQMNIIPYIVQKTKKTNGVIITFVDITDRIKVLKELERLNASHETFIYSVSHDLKGPLANIEGLVNHFIKISEDIQEGREEDLEDQKSTAALLEKSIVSMRNIINELSEITKIESNYKDEVETVKIENLLKEVKMVIRDSINKSKAIIHIDIQEPELNISRKNLRSILYNLLTNAIKYRSRERIPEVYIKTRKEEGMVLISVRDNGLGIDKEDQHLLFTPFSRIEKEVEGTGIGLYLVKKIIENEGGRITVSSEVGVGSEFCVYLNA
jgi:two-component system phosphate regulon sensor histidine kinase PhoR